jgi:hypothetical protein
MKNANRDDVTVGQIRKVMEEQLEIEITELSRLIRKGHNERHASEEYLSKIIGGTLTRLDNLHLVAGLPELKKLLS